MDFNILKSIADFRVEERSLSNLYGIDKFHPFIFVIMAKKDNRSQSYPTGNDGAIEAAYFLHFSISEDISSGRGLSKWTCFPVEGCSNPRTAAWRA